jgi:hypothetical protein
MLFVIKAQYSTKRSVEMYFDDLLYFSKKKKVVEINI